MVIVEINSNVILVKPINSMKNEETKRTYQHLLLRLKQVGVEYYSWQIQHGVENCALRCHRWNVGEVVIRNFKAHYLSILAGTDPRFPLQLWDSLLPQARITLNLLRQANANPKLLVYACLNGIFDYNKCHWPPWDVKSNSTKSQTAGEHGHIIQSTVGTYTLPPGIISLTTVMSNPEKSKRLSNTIQF